MSRNSDVKLVISGDGKMLAGALDKSAKSIKSFAGKAGGMLAGVGSKLRGSFNSMAGKMSPFAMIGGAAGVVMAARNLAEYQDSLSSLAVTARLSSEDMAKLDKRVHDLAYTTGQTREGMVGALRDMVGTVDKEFAVESIEHVGKAATAMSIDIKDAAGAFTIFRRDMGATADEAAELFNTMAAMDGDFALDKLATSVSTLGLNKDNFGQYNALIQTVKGQMGGADAAAKAIDNIAMRIQSDRKVRRELERRGGGNLFDTEGNIKDFREFAEFMSTQSADLRKRMFGQRDSKAFIGFDMGAFDDFIKSGKEASFVSDAFARKQQGAKFQLNALSAAAKEFAGSALSPILGDLTSKLHEMTSNPEKMAAFRDEIVGIGGALADMGKAAVTVFGGINGAIGIMTGHASKALDVITGRGPRRVINEYMRSKKVSAEHERVNEKLSKLSPDEIQKYSKKVGLVDGAGKPVEMDEAGILDKKLSMLIAYNKDKQNAQNINVDNPVNINMTIKGDKVITESDNPTSRPNVKVNRGAL